ncbi:hypothetical protein BO70DRAFT_184225 [Aspergillus heteromorphus CBS 117.55]|uniref:Uncharacterized protein n=1 Tax=Aspergillus heteromorphus CBS 117.55 TaxID=1448321 RepID=A0A317WTA7_9EURO|nr:uncharacterized protein BO70DRAFT_184225 [Aspergillus heteromorphus CBS 117.55]PWY88522.1 hypothetical protein BO70DRAFT_184225 [Aspergillus heteromorphus CBS 117.55]
MDCISERRRRHPPLSIYLTNFLSICLSSPYLSPSFSPVPFDSSCPPLPFIHLVLWIVYLNAVARHPPLSIYLSNFLSICLSSPYLSPSFPHRIKHKSTLFNPV